MPPVRDVSERQLGPDIFRKRLLIEGYFAREPVDEQVLRAYFREMTTTLSLRTYADPIVHRTAGAGKPENEGYDAFVPLIDSGIYVCVWSKPRFLSVILFTCAEFDAERAVSFTCDFYRIGETSTLLF